MSRSGYSDEIGHIWSWICWRGAVTSAIRGKHGQAFLREMAAVLDAMPVKELAAHELVEEDGSVCALGAVGVSRGIPNLAEIDAHDERAVAEAFGIPRALACEIMYVNDEMPKWLNMSSASRWLCVREWVEQQLRKESADEL